MQTRAPVASRTARLQSAAEVIAGLSAAYRDNAQGRTDFALQHFVVRQHDPGATDWTPRQWHQVVIEMHSVHQGIEQAIVSRDRARCDLADILGRWCFTANARARREVDAREQRTTIDGQQHRIDGLLDQFETLATIFASMPEFTKEDLEADERRYWTARLTRQAHDAMLGNQLGAGQGNIAAIRQAQIPLERALAAIGEDVQAIDERAGALLIETAEAK